MEEVEDGDLCMHLPQILDFTSTIKGKWLYENHLYIREFKFVLTTRSNFV